MIPVRYAKALFEFAAEKGCDERVYGQMGKLAAAFVREPELRRALDNPVLPESEKLKLVYAACGGDPGEVLERFAQLVLHNRRERFLQWIALMYREQYRKAHGISTGKLETAVPVAPRYRAPPEGADRGADAREARAGGLVKPDLIGGFVFEMNCERLDASVATQLRSIKRQFAEKNRRIV